MNIFVTSPFPAESAICLPDKHVVKMPLECCQMLSIVASEKWGHNYGSLYKKDNTPYNTEKGAFRNHPCTKWAMDSIHNAYWLIKWGMNLADEYALRYNKIHSCHATLVHAYYIFPKGKIAEVTPFVRAMPDEFKLDTTIDTFTAYKMYISSKLWVASNYLRMPERKPDWI
jgi:hypothetical protein